MSGDGDSAPDTRSKKGRLHWRSVLIGVLAAELLLVLLLAAGWVVLKGQEASLAPPQPPSSTNESGSIATAPVPTKPPGISQPQLPLVTSVRWAVDRSATGSLLILYYTGYASSFAVVDPAGAPVLRFGIAGSGIFDDKSCVAHPLPGENVTWLGVDAAISDAFAQRYRDYRVIADGVPAGQVTLPLSDSGCRGVLTPPPSITPRLPAGYDLPSECRYYDYAITTGSATAWKIFCPQGLPSNYLRPSLAAQGWVSCGTKLWQKADMQLAVGDTVNTLEYNAILDQRPLASSGCVGPAP